MKEAWIIDACRTPRGIGKFGKGSLSQIHPQRLGAVVLRALAERNQLNTAEVDDIVWGCSSQRGQSAGDLGRMSALDAGYDIRSSAVTLDRVCGSGITSVSIAACSIMAGQEDVVIAGGCAVIPGIDEVVATRTQVSTLIANPFANMVLSDRVRAKSLDADASSLMVACGLALRRFDP